MEQEPKIETVGALIERPRRRDIGGALVGGALGYLFGGSLWASAAGGLAGHAVSDAAPIPLEEAVRDAFVQAGLNFAMLYREGAYKATAVHNIGAHYYLIESVAPESPLDGGKWTNIAIEDWHYANIVRQVPEAVKQIA